MCCNQLDTADSMSEQGLKDLKKLLCESETVLDNTKSIVNSFESNFHESFTLQDQIDIINNFVNSPTIRTAHINGVFPRPQVFHLLTTLKNLQSMYIDADILNQLADSDSMKLIRHLETIQINGDCITDKILNLPTNIYTFNIKYKYINESNAMWISMFLKSCRNLECFEILNDFDYKTCKEFNQTGLNSILTTLKTMKTLRKLVLMVNNVSIENYAILPDLIHTSSNFRCLIIEDEKCNFPSNFGQRLSQVDHMECVDILVTDSSVEELSIYIQKTRILKDLTLYCKSISESNLGCLIKSLNQNLSLNYLALSVKGSQASGNIESIYRINPAICLDVMLMPQLEEVNYFANNLEAIQELNNRAFDVIESRKLIMLMCYLPSELLFEIHEYFCISFPNDHMVLSSVFLNRTSIGSICSSNPFSYGEMLRESFRYHYCNSSNNSI
ncbi:hypothetical protein HDV02_002188 [Globomyces sp. JEL0801]|nr:hypothetical protein HDV02_002188 [Globomyces sp. JEL0801]